jgi:hypothetical protein
MCASRYLKNDWKAERSKMQKLTHKVSTKSKPNQAIKVPVHLPVLAIVLVAGSIARVKFKVRRGLLSEFKECFASAKGLSLCSRCRFSSGSRF